jgi:hypothetical protein
MFALMFNVMSGRKTIDQRPGAPPEIRAEGDSVTFHLAIAGLDDRARLVIRCDADGEVWASLAGTAVGLRTGSGS